MRNKKVQILFHLSSIILGGLLYICFRTPNLLMFKWASVLHLNNVITYFRSNCISTYHISDWIIFSLPDGLWMFSGTTLLLLVWNNEITTKNLYWLLLLPFCAIFSELLQGLHLLRGTYDWVDIIAYVIGFILSVLFFSNIKSITS